MLAKAFVSAGVFGDSSHIQRMDFMNFCDTPDTIVYRTSVPHAGRRPEIVSICKMMEQNGYEVIPVLIDREDYYMELSQVKRWHQESVIEARKMIVLARQWIASQMKEMGAQPVLVQYEIFVSDPVERRKLFTSYSLPEPDMYFFNANDTYE